MILIYRPDKNIHQFFAGFGVVSIGESGTLLIDGQDTTTCAADVSWKYITDQTLERGEDGVYLYDADHYAEIQKPLSEAEWRANVEMALLDLAEAML